MRGIAWVLALLLYRSSAILEGGDDTTAVIQSRVERKTQGECARTGMKGEINGARNVASAAEAGGVAFSDGSYNACTAGAGQAGANAGEGIFGTGSHCTHQIIDGLYGNSHSWIVKHANGYAGVRFAKKETIMGIQISRDGVGGVTGVSRGGHNDRYGGTYIVEVSTVEGANHLTPAADWCEVFRFTRATSYIQTWAFAPVEATALRIKLTENGACIDELKVWAGLNFVYPLENIASQDKGGIPFGDGSLTNVCSSDFAGEGLDYASGTHCWENINDGKTGDANAWIPQRQQGGFAGVRFKTAQAVAAIRVSRALTGTNTDRVEGTIRVQYTTAKTPNHLTPYNEWKDLGSFLRENKDAHYLMFPTVTATAVRIVASAPNHESAPNLYPCIDELEVYGDVQCGGVESIEGGADGLFRKTGIVLQEKSLALSSFDVVPSCGPGWFGPTDLLVTRCAEANLPITVSGTCRSLVCASRNELNVEGYQYLEKSMGMNNFEVDAACAPGYIGSAIVQQCTEPQGLYHFTGCKSLKSGSMAGKGSHATTRGDPHVTTVHGEKFDINQAATHTLLHVPRDADADNTLIKIDANVKRIWPEWCKGIYIQSLAMSGKLLQEPLHFSTDMQELNPTAAARVGDHSPEEFAKLNSKVELFHGSSEWPNDIWPARTAALKFDLEGLVVRVSWMHQDLGKQGFDKYGKINYLDCDVRRISKLLKNFDLQEVGGLLGDDDHAFAAQEPDNCKSEAVKSTHEARMLFAEEQEEVVTGSAMTGSWEE